MADDDKDERRKLLRAAIREEVDAYMAEQGKKKGEPPAPKNKDKDKSAWDAFWDAVGLGE